MSELFKRNHDKEEEVAGKQENFAGNIEAQESNATPVNANLVPAPSPHTILSLLEDVDNRMNTLLEKQRTFLEGLD